MGVWSRGVRVAGSCLRSARLVGTPKSADSVACCTRCDAALCSSKIGHKYICWAASEKPRSVAPTAGGQHRDERFAAMGREVKEGVFDGQVYQAPHCNEEVLHAPGVCHYCDAYPSRQAARAVSGGTFSPPEAWWSGNAAVKAGEVHEHMGARYVVGAAPDAAPRPTWLGRLRGWIKVR